MKSFCAVISGILLGLSMAACSSREEKPANQKAAANRPANAAPAANAANTTAPVNNEGAAVTEKEVVSQDPIGDVRKSKREAMRKEAENAPPPKIDLEAELKKSTQPAPENSEFAAVLTDVVFERRTFKNHPQLSKVEKITNGAKKTIKVFLIDGKVIEVPGEKIDFISKASSATILKAAGLSVPATAAKKPKM